MDKLTGIKIKYNDGTYSDQIPVGALAANIGWDSVHTLIDAIGTVDITNDGSLQDQIIKRNNYIRFHADYSDPQTITTNNSTGRRVASDQGAVAMGRASISSGYAAFTGGNIGTVSSQDKRYSSEATGAGSVAWNGALASGTNSLAFGGTLSNDQMQSDTTSPQYGRSVASGIGSIAFGGVANKATGTYAFAGGQNSSAEHNLSFAYGNRVRSGKDSQAVFGKYNTVDSGASLVVGVGTDSSNRANAFTTGNDTVNNYITIGAKKITDTDAGILKKLTPSRNLCVVDTAHITKPSFWTLGTWQGVWTNSKGFTCNRPSYWTLTDGGGFWYHLSAGTYTFGCNINYKDTTTTQVYYIIQFVPDSDTTTVTNLTEYKLTEASAQRIEETFTLSEAGTFIFRPTSYATSGGSGGEYQTRYEYVQIEVGNMATEYEAVRDYYTIGDALIATGSTAPTSTLTGNVYIANGYGYGADGVTFSKFITKSDLTNGSATSATMVYTVPFLTYSDIGESYSTTLTSNLASKWLKYVVANYGAEIGTRPIIGQLQTSSNFIATITGSGSNFNTTSDYPTRSSFIATDGSAYTHRFYTFDGTFVFYDLISTFGGTLTGNLYMPQGYAYGADGSTFSKLVTEGQLGSLSHLFSGLPTLSASTVGVSTSASFSDYTQAWLKYICAHYSGVINGTAYINNGNNTSADSGLMRPVVAILYPNSAYLCIGAIYNPGALSGDLPQHSGFTAFGVAGAAQYIYTFGTSNYTFSCRRVGTSTF